MNTPISDVTSQTDFVTEADWVPSFWQFLTSLDKRDLIAELIQNDLDQGATRTVIAFGRDYLTSEGDGASVDAAGWQRLRLIYGAGHQVPAKKSRIGVKNHGLKTAFTIGNRVRVVSAGLAITQTLFTHGDDEPPFPGASPEPYYVTDSPDRGCRIEVEYRVSRLEPREGEALVLPAPSQDEIDTLFTSACDAVPGQFAGIVGPNGHVHYEVILQHWHLGKARFRFSARRPQKVDRSMWFFRRQCRIDGDVEALPDTLREEGVQQYRRTRGPLRRRLPDFFSRQEYHFVEVSWPVDARGRPLQNTGRYRYPLGYPEGPEQTLTGYGAHFNAPILSDTERHGPSTNDPTNLELRGECEALLARALAKCLVPKWQADGLRPLVPEQGAIMQRGNHQRLLGELAKNGQLPFIDRYEAVRLLFKGRKGRELRSAERRLTRGAAAEKRRYRFVVPQATWEKLSVNGALAALSPPREKQLDPRVAPRVIEILTEERAEGWGVAYITFDEGDAFTRVAGSENDFFGPDPNAQRALAEPVIASLYLDLIEAAIKHKELSDDQESELQQALLLPTMTGDLAQLEALYQSAPLPSDIPGLSVPPILHPRIAGHRLFRRRGWRRRKFTMDRFFASGALGDTDVATRRAFWRWLSREKANLSKQQRIKLADIPVWSDSQGAMRCLGELCEPRSQRVAEALKDVIYRPSREVLRSKLTTSAPRRKTTIRSSPTEGELQEWLDTSVERFAVGETADDATKREVDRFESDVLALARDSATNRRLRSTDLRLPALARDGTVQWRDELVLPTQHVMRLQLLGYHVLASSKRRNVLDRLTRPLPEPRIEMLIAAFNEDPENVKALHPRLRALLQQTEEGGEVRERLAGMSIVPWDGRMHAPCDLAFRNPKGNYWGEWKIQISGKGLSQNDQRCYLDAGVTPASPTQTASQQFFQWLSEQSAEVQERHMPCVVRHLNDRAGPVNWASIFTDIPCLPGQSKSGLRLLSLRYAKHNPVYIPDVPRIAEQVVRRDPHVYILIEQIEEVHHPVTSAYRVLGIRSMRDVVGDPVRVTGSGGNREADDELAGCLDALRSPAFRRDFLKVIDSLGVEKQLVRQDWKSRVDQVETIRFAEEVESVYELRGHNYPIQEDAGFDPQSGTLWLQGDTKVPVDAFFEAVATQRIFKRNARPVDCLALKAAVSIELPQQSFGRPLDEPTADGGDETGETEPFDGAWNEDDTPGGAPYGHSPFTPDPSRNVPSPDPLSDNATERRRSRSSGGSVSSSSDRRETTDKRPLLEREHTDDLRTRHYASHCQMCLCDWSPAELAPSNSYVQWEEMRRTIVEVHHADPKAGGGARHAGNLVLLCTFHHNNYGRKLSRSHITTALRESSQSKVVVFGAGEAPVSGIIANVPVSDDGEIVSLFFTREHANYWLSHDR